MAWRRRADDEALQRLYRDNVDAVYAFFAYSVARGSAEDLTASTFERAIKAFGRYDPEKAGQRTWLLSIARNLLIDHIRSRRNRPTVAIDDHDLDIAFPVAEDPYVRKLDEDELRAWLAHLGDRERQVIALRFGADLEAAQVAELLDLSAANVHQIVSRSLKRLREVAERSGVSRSA